jgi:hypothetical protein
MNAHRIATALLAFVLSAAPAAAVVTQETYLINPGSQYQYLPPPEGPGIPGGMPNNYQLDFGIGGTFVYEFDTAGPTARLLNLNLFLTDNDAIQAAPPPFGGVTADRVETYLASHTFVTDFIGGLVHLESSTHPNLKLTDALNGNLAIFGGYDNTPVDGDGLNFEFSARLIPEPAAISLLAMAAFAVVRRRR